MLHNQPQIEHYRRQTDAEWIYHRFDGLEAVVNIESIHCMLKLADAYDRVVFPAD